MGTPPTSVPQWHNDRNQWIISLLCTPTRSGYRIPALVSNPWTCFDVPITRVLWSNMPTWFQRPACNFSQSSSVMAQWPGYALRTWYTARHQDDASKIYSPASHICDTTLGPKTLQPLIAPANGCCIVTLAKCLAIPRAPAECLRGAVQHFVGTWEATALDQNGREHTSYLAYVRCHSHNAGPHLLAVVICTRKIARGDSSEQLLYFWMCKLVG